MPAEIQNEKCTPARWRMAAASGHTEANSMPAQPRRPCRWGNEMKNARRRGEERLQPAGIWRQIPRRHRRDDHAGGETE
ncbi:hypothetical protein [Bianquea renquensis]|uniref:Uncharacterized protein n=1 Tax=Bianquea renquensis TaxID=2763661 RepID=A0A926DVN7_9FIRM|nr:hypothetical protein [Bianquea renquensis]MBC8544522.1 hypothetical protein [Bianquea renquensis]